MKLPRTLRDVLRLMRDFPECGRVEFGGLVYERRAGVPVVTLPPPAQASRPMVNGRARGVEAAIDAIDAAQNFPDYDPDVTDDGPEGEVA